MVLADLRFDPRRDRLRPHLPRLWGHGPNGRDFNRETLEKMPKAVATIVLEAVASYESASIMDADKSEAIGLKRLRYAGAKISTLPVDQQRAWAVALEDWPNERANDLSKYGIDGVATMNKYMTYMEEACHKWLYRYALSKK